MAKLKVSLARAPGGTLVKLQGVLDENLEAEQFISFQGGVVVLDLDGVTRVTSFGVREWFRALASVKREYLGLARCRPQVVLQLNMVRDFAAGGEVLSFYAPYLCTSCGRDYEVLIDTRKQRELILSLVAPANRCPFCAGVGAFDDVPAMYFSYLSTVSEPRPPALVDTLLGAAPVADGPSFKAGKEVDGALTVLRFAGLLDGSVRIKRLIDGLEGNVLVLLDDLQAEADPTLKQLEATAHQLAHMASTKDTTFYVANGTVGLLACLATSGQHASLPLVISAKVHFKCGHCRANEHLDIDRASFARIGAMRPRCEQCGHELQATASAAQLEAIDTLPRPVVPDDVLHHLGGLATETLMTKRERPGANYGRYTLLHSIGAGGMAEVFLAKQQGVAGFAKRVVVKRIAPHLASDPEFVKLFLKEARTAARISHPNVVQVLDLGELEGRYFMALEYVRGADLKVVFARCVEAQVAMPLEMVSYVMVCICDALHAAHTSVDEFDRPSPIVHRDVSPHNVLVSLDGHVKLTDFGIAKSSDFSSRTPTGGIKGKLAYMAPEQFSSGVQVDARVDLFAAGVVLYQSLTLEQPFERSTEYLTQTAVLNEDIAPVSGKRPDCGPRVDAVIAKCLTRDPALRWQTAAELRAAVLSDVCSQPASAAQFAAWLKGPLALDKHLRTGPVREGTASYHAAPDD